MRIFAEGDLGSALEGQMSAMRREVDAEPKNKLLNMNEAEYIEYLVQKYSIQPLIFLWDENYISDREEMIPAEHFPFDFNVYSGKSYPKQVITYHIPFTGEADLLKMTPSTRILWSTDVNVTGENVSFDIINWRDDSEQIKQEADGIIGNIRQQYDHITREVEQFNANLPTTAQSIVKARKEKILRQSSLLERLDVPVRKSESTPETFVVPIVKRKVIIKPNAPNAAFTPEPTLETSLYNDILRLCRDMGIELERHPSIYADKDEEALRDHFIMVLSPHFDSVTGETFNKTGKTDILIRHESANVFVAECKFWAGAKAFQKTISQALGYLTWRDSKAAIILFVRNKLLGPVLEQIDRVAAAHPCCVSAASQTDEAWFNFNFHLLEDPTRGVKLAVLCFHLPSPIPKISADM